MTTRKTYSLPDDLARAIEREARDRSTTESAIVREGVTQYLASRSESKLHLWFGKGTSQSRSKKPLDHDAIHEEIVPILEKNVMGSPGRRRKQ